MLYVGISQILDAFDSTGGVVVAKDITFTVTTDDCNAFMVFGGHASAVGQYFEINNISIKEVF